MVRVVYLRRMQVDQEVRPRPHISHIRLKTAWWLPVAEDPPDSSLRCRLSLKDKDRTKEDKVLKVKVSMVAPGSVELGVVLEAV